ncbi:hypothetical protein AB2T63_04780 [Clostridium butyricum]|nr:hypothetical protein [Clostridium butyricum]
MIQILQIIILILELIAKGISEENAIADVCKANNANVDIIRKILKNK